MAETMEISQKMQDICRSISDGDSRASNLLVNENINGDIEISKEECINHVAKNSRETVT